MKKNHEKSSEKLVGWLANFADREAQKLITSNNIDTQDPKNAGYIDNILDIVNRNKKTSVDAKVEKYRELVGLDLIDALEKSGNDSLNNKEAAFKNKLPLSIRDKTARSNFDESKVMDRINEYVVKIIQNRNGAIATPAIFDQLESYLKVDKDWLRNHYDKLTQMIDTARKQFTPQLYNDVPINDLARTDDPLRGDKEPPPFLPPANTSGT